MKKNYIYYFLIFLLIGFSFIYDFQIIKFIESLRNPFLDYFFISIAFASNVFLIFFILTSLFLWNEHKQRWILPLWVSGFFSILVSFLLKIIITRRRPFQEGVVSVLGVAFNFMKNNFNTWNFSFPSFQSVLVFSALPILDKEFKKLKYIWLIFASLVALSRVYFGVHYFSDVLSGALIGYFIGVITLKIEEKYYFGKKFSNKITKVLHSFF